MLMCDSGGAMRLWSVCLSFCLSVCLSVCSLCFLFDEYVNLNLIFHSNDREVKPGKLGVHSS